MYMTSAISKIYVTPHLVQHIISFLQVNDKLSTRLVSRFFNVQVIHQHQNKTIVTLDIFINYLMSQLQSQAYSLSEVTRKQLVNPAAFATNRKTLYIERGRLIDLLASADPSRLADIEQGYIGKPMPPLFMNIFSIVRIYQKIIPNDEVLEDPIADLLKQGEVFEALRMAHTRNIGPDLNEDSRIDIYYARGNMLVDALEPLQPIDKETIEKLDELYPASHWELSFYKNNHLFYCQNKNPERAKFFANKMAEAVKKNCIEGADLADTRKAVATWARAVVALQADQTVSGVDLLTILGHIEEE